jgi:hypothetical protein
LGSLWGKSESRNRTSCDSSNQQLNHGTLLCLSAACLPWV